MKVVIFLFLSVLNALSLTREELEKIATMPHDRTNLVEELKMFPEAREYLVQVTLTEVGKQSEKMPALKVQEKTVQGKYIVTTFGSGEVGGVIMVVEFDKKTQAFHKWVLFSQEGEVGQMVGTVDKESGTVAWLTVKVSGDFTVMALEKHGDDKVTWTELHLEEGKVVRRLEGKAIKTK